ncbi:MAG: thioredoxin family protein [Pseudanabaena sp.]
MDESPQTTQRYAVRSVPTLLVFKNGQKTAIYTGLTNRDKITQLLGL